MKKLDVVHTGGWVQRMLCHVHW